MNREIKFRFWSGSSMMNHTELFNDKYTIAQLSSPLYTPMQYTGLKDVENNEIYEGDIIFGYNNPHTVTFADGAFYLTYKNSSVRLSRTCGALKIIGNIYQNPDLLQLS